MPAGGGGGGETLPRADGGSSAFVLFATFCAICSILL
jgi:hypothetical protein